MARSTPPRTLLIKIALGIAAAAALAFAPQPAFAQHGGGGHAGGHFGGGGHFAGGGRASGGSAHAAPPLTGAGTHNVVPPHSFARSTYPGTSSGLPPGLAMFAEPSHAGRGPATSTSNANNWNRNVTLGFPPTATGGWSAESFRGGAMSFSGQGHEMWQESPRPATSANPTRPGPAVSMLPPGPPLGVRRRPFPPFAPGFPIYGPGLGFYPFAPFGFGFGAGCGFFGGCGYLGFGSPLCDPLWGWNCFGYAPGMPLYDSVGAAPSGTQDETSNEYGPFSWQNPPAAGNSEVSAAPDTLIYLKDGTSYAITDYWLVGDKLHYVTNYGGENSIDPQQLDFQRTVDENASRGVNFTLRPAPSPPPAAAPAAPGPQPPPQQ